MSYLDTSIFYVYQLRLETSEEPFYIGKGKGDRTQHHFRTSSLKIKSIKNNIINKAIKDCVKIICEILHENLLDEVSLCIEQQYIDFYGRIDLGTGILANHTDGGEGTSGISDETKDKIKQSKSGMSEERKQLYYNRISSSYKNKSIEDKNKIQIKKKNSMNSMEEHKKKSRSKKISISKIEFHKNKSEEDKLNFSNKIRESNLSRHIQPWETYRCTQEQINLVWLKADHLFDLFLLGNGAKKMATMFNGNYSNFKGIVEKFKLGWVPKDDQHWIKRFCAK